jgi:hypothetical protein
MCACPPIEAFAEHEERLAGQVLEGATARAATDEG